MSLARIADGPSLCILTPANRPTAAACPQISTEFVRDVNEAVQVGQAVTVRVLNVDQQSGKFAVSTIPEGSQQGGGGGGAPTRYEPEYIEGRQQQRPRGGRQQRRPTPTCEEGDLIEGKVVSAAPFGAFVDVRARAWEGWRGVARGGRPRAAVLQRCLASCL